MELQIQDAKREQVKLKIGMSGASGSGKTKSSLLLARGMVKAWSEIGVIDTENGSASLFVDDVVPEGEAPYKVLNLSAPFSPNRYVECIEKFEKSGVKVIIIDSITHEWSGSGGCLELHDQYTQADKAKNSYTAWNKVTPLHDKFINAILQSPCHIITTVRRKQEYEMVKDEQGKTKVNKVGTKEITREGYEYEVTFNFEINMDHYASLSKDRTGLFDDVPAFKIDITTGEKIHKWNMSGAKMKQIKKEISQDVQIENAASESLINKLKAKCPTIDELNKKCGTKFTEWHLIQTKEATNCLVKLM